MRCTEYVARWIIAGERERQGLLGPVHRFENNIKTDLKEAGYGLCLADLPYRPVDGFCEFAIELPGNFLTRNG
jgi:hypothetical protein